MPTTINTTIIIVVHFLIDSSLLVKSDTSELQRLTNFRKYGDITFEGWSQNLVPVLSKFQCIIDCVSQTNCQGFTYNNDTCLHTQRDNVSSLQFTSNPDNVRIRRNILLQNLDYDPVSMTETLDSRLLVGDMIYLKAILLQYRDVCIEIHDTLGKENITFHVVARCNNAMCNDRFVHINNKWNSNWNSTSFLGRTYTLKVNKVFEFHVLITANGIITYLNGVVQYTLNTKLSALTANYVSICGYMKVLEFSL